ncbi:MAG: hypothetical protein AAGE52_36555 [Myxococcota bacterium]
MHVGEARHSQVGGVTPAAETVREAVAAVAAPEVAARILRRALHLAQESEVPPGGSRLRVFVEHHLRAATTFVMGEDAATAIRDQLAPLLVRIPTIAPAIALDEPPLLELEADTPSILPDPLPEPATLRRVLVATLDEDRNVALRRALRGIAETEAIEDVVALLDAIEGRSDNLLLIIDCEDPSVQPTTLATIAPDLPVESIVVLWGASEEELDAATVLVPDSSRWIACDQTAEVDSVASMVRALL